LISLLTFLTLYGKNNEENDALFKPLRRLSRSTLVCSSSDGYRKRSYFSWKAGDVTLLQKMIVLTFCLLRLQI